MPNAHPHYSPGYRRRIVKLVRSGRSPEDLAMRIPPSVQTIRRWVEYASHADAVALFRRALKRPQSFPSGGWVGDLLESEHRYKVKEVVTILRDWGMNPKPKEDPFGWFNLSAPGNSMWRGGKSEDRNGQIGTLPQLWFIRSILEHEPVDVIETLLRANDLPSKRALKRILRFGRRGEHQNYMAIIWNKPLRQLRGLIARHPRYRMEFLERSIP
jgi:hypothetical protein